MKRCGLLPVALVFALLSLSAIAGLGQSARNPSISSNPLALSQPGSGTIGFMGVVKSVSPKQHTFVMATDAYADENSKHFTVFKQPRSKVVSYADASAIVDLQGRTVVQLKPGMPVHVEANADGTGAGKPVTADTITVYSMKKTVVKNGKSVDSKTSAIVRDNYKTATMCPFPGTD